MNTATCSLSNRNPVSLAHSESLRSNIAVLLAIITARLNIVIQTKQTQHADIVACFTGSKLFYSTVCLSTLTEIYPSIHILSPCDICNALQDHLSISYIVYKNVTQAQIKLAYHIIQIHQVYKVLR